MNIPTVDMPSLTLRAVLGFINDTCKFLGRLGHEDTASILAYRA